LAAGAAEENKMAKRDDRWDVRLTAGEESGEPGEAREEQPFVIVVLGDFRGAAQGTVPARPIDLDRDNFDSVMQRLKPRWEGVVRDPAGRTSAELPVALAFAELDDFHPDRLAQKIPPLKALIETRRALANPKKFADAAAEVARWAEAAEPAPPSREAASSVSKIEPQGGSVLDQILGQSEVSEPRQPPTTPAELRRLLEALVAPHLIRVDTTRQAELTAAVDEALAVQVRAILHDPTFQRLEATWRSLWRLVTAVESDVELKVRLLPCGKDRLRRELIESDDPEASPLVRALVEPASVAGGVPPALLVGDYEFDHNAEDLQLLGMLGAIGQQLRAPFVTAASPRLLGCESFTDLRRLRDLAERHKQPEFLPWQQFRRLPQARWVGLGLPRLLCRLPYGADTDRVETFDFEEWTDASGHDDYVWANPAFAIATLAATAFGNDGWDLDLSRQVHRLESLPLHVHRRDGESVTTPCAEVVMTDTLIEALNEAGFIPLASYQNRDVVALPCVQALGVPRAPLPLGVHA
jgi:type VI secretion system protein ImpC